MAITIASDLSWDQNAWERFAYFALRPEMYFDAVADVKGAHVTQTGINVKFNITNDLAATSTALTESTDITPVSVTDANVTVTLAEYGNAVQDTALVRGTSMIPIDPIVANVIGYNAGISLDTLAQIQLKGGTNVRYATGTGAAATARNMISDENTLRAVDVRYVVAKLRGANVKTNMAGLYTAFIHPDVSVDLTAETDLAGWRAPHAYNDGGPIAQGEIGAFQGVRFVETPRGPVVTDGGATPSTTDVYLTIFTGQQALAKAYSSVDGNGAFPRLSPTPVIDLLRRFTGMGWYWLGGYGRFREASLYRVESSSSIGTNT